MPSPPLHLLDVWHRNALRLGYPSRAFFKLKEIDDHYFFSSLFSPTSRVLDLGSGAGSWAIYAGEKSPSGFVITVDSNINQCVRTLRRKEFTHRLPSHLNIFPIECDVRHLSPFHFPLETFDVVLSDLCPSTVGDRPFDALKSNGMVDKAAEIAKFSLKRNGHFIAKVLNGRYVTAMLDDLKKDFGRVSLTEVNATREHSAETFIMGMGFKGGERTRK